MKNYNYIGTILLCISVFFAGAGEIQAQRFTPAESKEAPSTCEYIRSAIDDSLVRISALKDPDSKIIIISYLGSDETSSTLNKTRVGDVTRHINFRAPDFKRYLTAAGEKRKGLGKVEIYVEGKLLWELFFKKNGSSKEPCQSEPY